MTFQQNVNTTPSPAVVGGRASMNPVQVVDAGPGGLVAGELGVTVGRFAWNEYDTAGGPGEANNYSPTLPTLPDGFISNEQQALITTYLGVASLVVPAGRMVTEYDRGDFWAKSTYSEAAIGNKVFANLFSGEILAAATGAFPTNDAGSAISCTASGTINTYNLVVSAIADSLILAPGQLVTGTGIPAGTYIESQYSGSTGAAGTYYLSKAITQTFTAETVTVASPEGIGGATATCSVNQGSTPTTLTISTLLTGHIAAGQYVKGTSIPTGTYISALTTYSAVTGTGNVTLSAAATATISSATISFSSWIETPWSVKSAGNVGDNIKIGIKN